MAEEGGLEKKKRRADEALAFFESLDEETRKAVYIASSILVMYIRSSRYGSCARELLSVSR